MAGLLTISDGPIPMTCAREHGRLCEADVDYLENTALAKPWVWVIRSPGTAVWDQTALAPNCRETKLAARGTNKTGQ